jgi:hypothetical protein
MISWEKSKNIDKYKKKSVKDNKQNKISRSTNIKKKKQSTTGRKKPPDHFDNLIIYNKIKNMMGFNKYKFLLMILWVFGVM